jgi:hypothetical protein
MADMILATAPVDVLRRAADDIARARFQLDLHGEDAIETARWHLELAIARLHPVAIDDDVPRDVQQAAQRCRVTLSSHLLAVDNLEAVGVGPGEVATFLRRATEAGALDANRAYAEQS